MLRYKILFLAIILLIVLSCSTDKSINNDIKSVRTDAAILSWQGAYAFDGCGFFIEIGEMQYKASNEDEIGDEYKINEYSQVKLEYFILAKKIKYICGDAPSEGQIDGIEII